MVIREKKKGSSGGQNLNKRQTRGKEQPKDILKEKVERDWGNLHKYGITEAN